MSAGHTHPLYRPGDSPVHRLPAQVKIIAAFLLVCCVVASPRQQFWAFGVYLLILSIVWAVAAIPPTWIARRAVIEIPFLVLVVLLPFAGGGARTHVAGVSLSADGLLDGWNILAKGTLGVSISLTLAGTTPLRDLLLGLQRLRAPNIVITIATLMLRYVDVLADEARRMRLARISRGHDPRFWWQAAATARSVGRLFLRCYERGERVHIAMIARGWAGTMPQLREVTGSRGQWVCGLAPAWAGFVVAVSSWGTLLG